MCTCTPPPAWGAFKAATEATQSQFFFDQDQFCALLQSNYTTYVLEHAASYHVDQIKFNQS